MKRIALSAALAVLALSGAAFAGPKEKGQGHKAARHAPHGVVERGPREVIRHARDVRAGARHAAARHPARHDNGLHLGHRKAWDRGERIPTVYLAPRYVIEDYRVYRLAPPPQGMVWVRPYPDAREYYLVQLATGLVSRVLGR